MSGHFRFAPQAACDAGGLLIGSAYTASTRQV